MLISIVVPAYNVKQYIRRCVECLINQTYKNLEIIIVDDGSTDGTSELCEVLAHNDSRIKVIHKQNGGLSSARNMGKENACGEYIFFLDSDDWLDLNYIGISVDALYENKVELLFTPYIKEYKKHSMIVNLFAKDKFILENELFKSYVYRRLFGPICNEQKSPLNLENLNTAWGKFYRHDVIKYKTFVDKQFVGLSEDLWFNITSLKDVDKALYLGNVYVHYNKTNVNSIVSSYHPGLFENWKKLYANMKYFIEENKLGSEYYEALSNRIVLNIFSLIAQCMKSGLSFNQKMQNAYRILDDELYREAFSSFSYDNMEMKWKIFYKLAEKKCVIGMFAELKAAEMIRKLIVG